MRTSSGTKTQSSNISTLALFALIGGVLLYYGWKKRDTKVRQAASSIGVSILFKALDHPYAAEMLGPFQHVIKDQLVGAQKLLT